MATVAIVATHAYGHDDDRSVEVDVWAQRLVAPQRFEPCEVPEPDAASLAPNEVILRVAAGGICGSDLPYFRGSDAPDPGPHLRKFGAPGFSMHEVAGSVVASRHPALQVGAEVVGWADRFNGLAEFAVCDGEGLHEYDRRMPATHAVMIQPLACVLYALEPLDRLDGRSVAVIGQGSIGLLFSHMAKSAGAERVVGIDRIDRSAVAATFGVDEMLWTSSDLWSASLSESERFDVVIEAVGHQSATFTHAIEAAAIGGDVLCFGVPDEPVYPLPMRPFLRKNLTLRSGITRERRRVLAQAEQYLRAHSHLAQEYVTHVFPAVDAQKAYEAAVSPVSGQVKIVVEM